MNDLQRLRAKFAGKVLMRCIGGCSHAKGTCTADPDYQRLIKLSVESWPSKGAKAMDEIEWLLDDWFHAEYAVRTQHPADGKPKRVLRDEAHQARANLARRLATAHEPR